MQDNISYQIDALASVVVAYNIIAKEQYINKIASESNIEINRNIFDNNNEIIEENILNLIKYINLIKSKLSPSHKCLGVVQGVKAYIADLELSDSQIFKLLKFCLNKEDIYIVANDNGDFLQQFQSFISNKLFMV